MNHFTFSLPRLAISLLVVSTLFAAGYAGAAFAEEVPIRIGLLMPSTGTFSGQATRQLSGMHLAIAEAGGRAGGRPLQIVEIDEPGDPQAAVQKVNGFTVGSGKVDAIVGVFSAQVGQALRDTLHNSQTITVITQTNSRSLTGSRKSPYIFRVSGTSYTNSRGLADWVNQSKYCASVTTLATNYSVGQEFTRYFTQPYVAGGGKIVEHLWTPLGTSDFSSFLTKLIAARPECVYVFLNGPDAVRFVQQFDRYGLRKQGVKLIGVGYLDRGTLQTMGKAAVGAVQNNTWDASVHDATIAPFVTAYESKYKGKPDGYVYNGYIGTKALIASINALGGRIEDRKQWAEALKAVSFPAGDGNAFRFDPATNTRKVAVGIYEVYEPKPGQFDYKLAASLAPISDPGDDVAP